MEAAVERLFEKTPPNVGESLADYTARVNEKVRDEEDHTEYTYKALVKKLGLASAEKIASVVKSVSEHQYMTLINVGVDFADDETQAIIASLTGLTDAEKTALSQIGRWSNSAWNDAAGRTAEDVTSADLLDQFTKFELQEHSRKRHEEARVKVDAGDIADMAALKAFLGA